MLFSAVDIVADPPVFPAWAHGLINAPGGTANWNLPCQEDCCVDRFEEGYGNDLLLDTVSRYH